MTPNDQSAIHLVASLLDVAEVYAAQNLTCECGARSDPRLIGRAKHGAHMLCPQCAVVLSLADLHETIADLAPPKPEPEGPRRT